MKNSQGKEEFKNVMSLKVAGTNNTNYGQLTSGQWVGDFVGDFIEPTYNWWKFSPGTAVPYITPSITTSTWSYPMYDRHSFKKAIKSETHFYELAGLGKESISVFIEDNTLKVAAKGVIKDEDFTFTNSVVLPHNADRNKIKCKFENGMLCVEVFYSAPNIKNLKIL